MSTRLVVAGPRPHLVSTEINEDKRYGYTTNYEYLGSEAEIDAQKAIERAKGATGLLKRSMGNGDWTLTAVFPFDAAGGAPLEPPTDTHELDMNVLQQDVFMNPKVRATLTEGELATLRDYIDRYKNREWNTFTEAVTEYALEEDPPDEALDLFEEIIVFGATDYRLHNTVYRRTITAASPLQVRASFVGAGQIWTTAQLKAHEALPDDWWFTLPTGWKWLKSPPNVSTVIGQRTQITYYYESASNGWSTLRYDNYTP